MFKEFWSNVDVSFSWIAALRTMGIVFLASGFLNKLGWKFLIKKDFRETKIGEAWQKKAALIHTVMGSCFIIASYFDLLSPIAIALYAVAFLFMVWAAIENVKLIRSNMFEYVEVYEDEWEGQKKSKIKEILYNQAQAEIKKKEEAEEAARIAAELEAEMEAEEYEDDEEYADDESAEVSEEADENEDK